MNRFRKFWGEALGFLSRSRKLGWIDFLIVLGVAGILFGILQLAGEWRGEHRQAIEIDLSPWALPAYTLFSLSRGLIAYAISLVFALAYGYWAAKDQNARRVLLPLLDILQSIPVLGFMPGLVLTLVSIFPTSNVGLELAAILMIFTGQVWNMTFSFYQSLQSIPPEMKEAGSIFRFDWKQRLRWIELPYAAVGLVWNSMMSMAGGWFFLMINESFVLDNHDFRLPGIGSYMSVAVAKNDYVAMIWAVVAMSAMIVLLDQLLWRPLVVWSQKFRVEESGSQLRATSWFLDFLRKARLVQGIRQLLPRRKIKPQPPVDRSEKKALPKEGWGLFSVILFFGLLGVLGLGVWKLFQLIRDVELVEWLSILQAAGITLSRVLLSTVLGTLWAFPVGLWIGLNPRLSRIFQPIVQVCASFPAPMLFPAVIALLSLVGISMNWGSILLMLLGTQWYILFNVIAGAMAIPADFREAAQMYRFRGWFRVWKVYFPAVFPFLVTGWVTAAGGAWNASIVAEFVSFKGELLSAFGLGAQISRAAATSDFPILACSVVVMSTVVVLFNHFVWRKCYQLAQEKYSLSK